MKQKKITEINDKLTDRQQDLFKATRKIKPYVDIADAIDNLRNQKQMVRKYIERITVYDSYYKVEIEK